MKIAQKLAVVSSILVVAGCSSWHEKQAKYNYNQQQYSSTYGTTGTGANSSYGASGTYQPNQGTSGAASTENFQSSGSSSTVVTQVQQQLRQDPALAALVPNLQISFQNGTLTLAGNVSSEQEKQKIETMVKNYPGVVTVNNQLQVSSQSQFNQPNTTEDKSAVGGTSDQSTSSQSSQSSQSTAPSESQQPATPPQSSTVNPSEQSPLASQNSTSDTNQISTTNNSTSAEQAAVSPSSSSSSITNQSTSSSGTLSPTSDRSDTSRIYSGTQSSATGTQPSTGAFDVNVQGATEADRSLGQQVMAELRMDTTIAAVLPTIKVNVENGKLTLRGSVKSEDEKKRIEAAAQRVTGISTVDNQLQVGTSSSETTPGSKQ